MSRTLILMKCKSKTKRLGRSCHRKTKPGQSYCWQHGKGNGNGNSRCPVISNNSKLIFTIRHGQGYHQKPHKQITPDPALTPLGIQQAMDISQKYPLITDSVQLIVTSPLRRATQTALIGLDEAIKGRGIKVVAHDALQEIWSKDADWRDAGRPSSELRKEFPVVDYNVVGLGDHYMKHKIRLTGNKFEKHYIKPQILHSKIKQFRRWLWNRPEKVIAITAHWGALNLLLAQELEGQSHDFHNAMPYTFIATGANNKWEPLIKLDYLNCRALGVDDPQCHKCADGSIDTNFYCCI